MIRSIDFSSLEAFVLPLANLKPWPTHLLKATKSCLDQSQNANLVNPNSTPWKPPPPGCTSPESTPPTPSSPASLPHGSIQPIPPTSPMPPLLPLSLLLLARAALVGCVATEFLYPNFTATRIDFIDSNGAFLASPSAVFSLAIYKPGPAQQSRFCLALVHSPTGTVVWSANRDAPVPDDGVIVLSTLGLSVSLANGSVVWSTPAFASPVRALRLIDSGNLFLLDDANTTLWQSFDHPTDTLISGQILPVGSNLTAAASSEGTGIGAYSLIITADDAVMIWEGGQEYWSMEGNK